MSALHPRSLQLRLVREVVAAAVVFAVLAGALAYEFGFRRASTAALQSLNGLLVAVEKTAAIGAYAGDKVLLQEVAEGLARDPQVQAVDIEDADGALLLRVGRLGPAAAGDGVQRVDRALVAPFARDETVGVLRLHVRAAQVHRAAREQAWTLALLMVAQTAVVTLVLLLAVQRLVSRPIVRIAREVHDLPPGTERRLQAPASHDRDELGRLTRAVNALLESNEQALGRERALRAEIEAMEAQYRQIFDSTSAGIFVLDRAGRLINGNPTVLKVIGAPADAMRRLQGEDFVRRVFARPERVHAMIETAAARRETVSADLELVSRGHLSCWVHCLISVQGSDAPHEHGLIEGVMYDVTERKRAEHAVRHRAEHDALTGLKNRAAGEAALERCLQDAGRDGQPVTLMYVDLDGFKQVNDRHGHAAGDRVLVACAQRLQQVARRGSDLAVRLGGDEFLLVLPGRGVDDPFVAASASTLVGLLCEPVALDDGREVRVGASVGVVSFPLHGLTTQALVERADAAMYQVKRAGKNAFAVALPAPGGAVAPAEPSDTAA